MTASNSTNAKTDTDSSPSNLPPMDRIALLHQVALIGLQDSPGTAWHPNRPAGPVSMQALHASIQDALTILEDDDDLLDDSWMPSSLPVPPSLCRISFDACAFPGFDRQ